MFQNKWFRGTGLPSQSRTLSGTAPQHPAGSSVDVPEQRACNSQKQAEGPRAAEPQGHTHTRIPTKEQRRSGGERPLATQL